MIRITLTGLVKFMGGSPGVQRTVVRNFKYPKGEGAAQAKYYREALRFIKDFHRQSRPAEWLDGRAMAIETEARQSAPAHKVRLSHNARAIRQYARHFATVAGNPGTPPKLQFVHADVRVAVTPDLLLSGDDDVLVKLNLTDTAVPKESAAIGTIVFGEATTGTAYDAYKVAYFDTVNGEVHLRPKAKAKVLNDVRAACENIRAIWASI